MNEFDDRLSSLQKGFESIAANLNQLDHFTREKLNQISTNKKSNYIPERDVDNRLTKGILFPNNVFRLFD